MSLTAFDIDAVSSGEDGVERKHHLSISPVEAGYKLAVSSEIAGLQLEVVGDCLQRGQ